MVIQNWWNNQCSIKNCRHDNGVLELGELVAEPAVRGVPEKLLDGFCAALRGERNGGVRKDEGGDLFVEDEEDEGECEERESEDEAFRRFFVLPPCSSAAGHCSTAA